MKTKRLYKRTIYKIIIVCFFIIVLSIILFNKYGLSIQKKSLLLIDNKTNKILYQLFNEKINTSIINNKSVNNILEVVKNSNGEIININYNMENSYDLLNKISLIIKDNINDLENGNINISLNDKYIYNGKNGLLFYIPLFINSNNILLNNIGPRIPIIVNFNETILTNIKTKITNYGFNNALLEVFVTVEMDKLIITPMKKSNKKFKYNILINAIVINGRVPEFYGDLFEKNSDILDIPLS